MMIQRTVLNGGLLLIIPGEGKQLLRVLSALLICISMLMFSSLAMPFRQVHAHTYKFTPTHAHVLLISCSLAMPFPKVRASACLWIR